MDKKPLYEKINIWIGIVAGICAILGISVFGGKALSNNGNMESTTINFEDNEIGDQSPVLPGGSNNNITYNYNYYTSQSSEPVSSIIPTSSSETEEESQFNFGQAIQHIYDNEKVLKDKIIDNEKNKPIYSSIYPGVSYWYILDKVRMISVTNGFRNEECSRIYYFDDDEKLTFALMKDNIGEHRLYFCDDILIRYIDEQEQNYDINQNLSEHECKWTDLALKESYEIFNGVKKTSDANDISVTVSYNPNTPQTSPSGVNILVNAITSFPAEHVTISAISDDDEIEPKDMHGGKYEWNFIANFYIKGTYIVTVTAYDSEGNEVSDSFEYIY